MITRTEYLSQLVEALREWAEATESGGWIREDFNSLGEFLMQTADFVEGHVQ